MLPRESPVHAKRVGPRRPKSLSRKARNQVYGAQRAHARRRSGSQSLAEPRIVDLQFCP